MSLGLALLGVFLWLFLNKTWEDEEASLRRETNLLFVNAVRGIESEVLDRLLVRRWKGLDGDSSVNISVKLPSLKAKGDTTKVFALFREQNTISESNFQQLDSGKTKIKIAFTTEQTSLSPDMSGALSMLMVSEHLGEVSDTANPRLLASLAERFDVAMRESGLSVQWRVKCLDDTTDTAPSGQMFLAGQYTDMLSGERFGAEISQYRGFLLQKIGPQILFSLLLFGCVGLAFLFVYQSFRKQMRLTEIKNEFIRNMTHELKTPISTVGVAIEALQNFDALDNPERTREYLEISKHELNRLSLLVDKVLRMSLFEQGEPSLKPEALDLRNLVEEVLAAMKLQFEKYRAEVSLSIKGTDFSLRGDRLHLVSVLYNLLENALKYSPLPPQITVSLTHTDNQLTLQVRDQGRGIPSEYLDRIFDKFFRVPTGDVHDVKGHGLGLNYVAEVVSLHQGRIEVNSQEGEGATFTVVLPTTTNPV